ncbi:hypothetical protein GCM10010503_45210 [Streptomyces lucensis JCM 4490]|uniref:Uncharacterized protein n=1 Tax=Streptomyces lucensis JCM 4490 TaxID=1306176 RepID=A0A918MU11_9ACTN|nr:hypothetical protein GCM10010503_45210 [Streptomyces lucensis JCM 4490]
MLGGVQVSCFFGEFGIQRVQHMSHLGLDGVGIGLLKTVRSSVATHGWADFGT